MVRVAINGFGRIGRMVVRAGIDDPKIEFVAVNDLTDTFTLAHLFKYDSIQGNYKGEVKSTNNSIIIDGKEIKVFAEKDPAKLPWKDLNIDVVVESTGLFTSKDKLIPHLNAGAKKVLLSAPAKDDIDFNIVMGVNEKDYKKDRHHIISNASCTTNCAAPVVKAINDAFKVTKGSITTVHAYTADQRLVDSPHKDFRRGRAAAMNIIPTTTGAAKSVALVIPSLKGKLDGVAIRVPVATGSITDLALQVEKSTTKDEINRILKQLAETNMKGIMEYSEEPLVSTDIIHNPASCIIDGLSTMVIDGNLIKILAWYDNEWGYSCRMIDVIKLLV
jgi:glyceraldehyde 3-phosphate dehydrogenase